MRTAVVALALTLAVLATLAAADHNCEAQWNFCQHGGVCHDRDTSNPPSFTLPQCACPAPYTGDGCEKTQRECITDNPCHNSGTCTNRATTNNQCVFGAGIGGDCYTCACKPGFGGLQCREINACWSNPCKHGTCAPDPLTPTVYQCSCEANATGTWGDRDCQTWYPNYDCNNPSMTPCQNGGTCNVGSGICSCAPGFDGTDAAPACQTPTFCHSNPCANGGTCNANSVPPRCDCVINNNATGWERPFCVNRAFCASSPCQNGGTCECARNSPSDPCPGTGAGRCVCDENHYGTLCEKTWTREGCGVYGCSHLVDDFFDQCDTGTNIASIAATNNFRSTCKCQGLWGDCQCNSTVADLCSSLPNACWNGGTCVSSQTGTYCSCPLGFYGAKCENYDNICTSNNKCQNGGKCSLTRLGSSSPSQVGRGYDYWLCDCLYPFHGEFCELTADVENLCYVNNPCGAHGNCTMRPHYGGYWTEDLSLNGLRKQLLPYQCNCAPGYYGDDCSLTAPVTLPTCEQMGTDFCKNGGTCYVDNTLGPVCACRCGTGGPNCEVLATDATRLTTGKLLDYCSQGDVCFNGGTCVNSAVGQVFECHCQPGFWGSRCQNAGKSAAAGVLPSLLVSLLAVAAAIAVNKH